MCIEVVVVIWGGEGSRGCDSSFVNRKILNWFQGIREMVISYVIIFLLKVRRDYDVLVLEIQEDGDKIRKLEGYLKRRRISYFLFNFMY